jgi:hypothetical protein
MAKPMQNTAHANGKANIRRFASGALFIPIVVGETQESVSATRRLPECPSAIDNARGRRHREVALRSATKRIATPQAISIREAVAGKWLSRPLLDFRCTPAFWEIEDPVYLPQQDL